MSLDRARAGPLGVVPAGTSDGTLSILQEQLWLLQRTHPESSFYNESRALTIDGPFKVHIFEQALADAILAHPELEVTVYERDGQPVSVRRSILPGSLLQTLELDDVLTKREPVLASIVTELVEKPFDLSAGPLIRVAVLRISPVEHILVIVAHHLMVDGSSMDEILAALAGAYATRESREAMRAEQVRSYAEFVRWQRASLANGILDEEREYWRRILHGAPSLTSFPTDRVRKTSRSRRGRRPRFLVPMRTKERAEEIARRSGMTVFSTFLAAFAIVLASRSRQADLIVGTGAPGRPSSEFARTVGLFANMLPLRLLVERDDTLAGLLEQAAHVLFDAFDNQYLPFGEIVTIADPTRDPAYDVLVQVVLTMWNARKAPTFGACTTRPFEVERNRARFDQLFEFLVQDDELCLFVEYDEELFDAETIGAEVSDLFSVVDEIFEDPTLSVAVTIERLRRMVSLQDRVGCTGSARARIGRGGAQPTVASERVLAAVESAWREVLELTDPIQRNDEFFAIGGHSMAASRTAALISERLKVRLPLRTFFECSQLDKLAAAVQRLVDEAARPTSALPVVDGDAPTQREVIYDLLSTQLQVWISEQMARGRADDFTAAAAFRVSGLLDEGALEAALSAVVAHHDMLRARVTVEASIPKLRVCSVVRLPLHVEHCVDVPERERAEYLTTFATRQARLGVPSDCMPMLRATLLRFAADDHALVLVQHHLITDGVAMQVLLADLAAAYRKTRRGQPAGLLAVPDHGAQVLRESEWLSSPEATSFEDWWREYLRNPTPFWPTRGRIGTSRSSRETRSIYAPLDEACVAGLETLARRASATPFMVTTAALAAVLADWNGSPDVLIATMADNRTRPGTARSLGCFVNPIVLRIACSPHLALRQLIVTVRAAVANAYGRQGVPFRRVVACADRTHTFGRMPIAQVTSEWFPSDGPRLELEGCAVRGEVVQLQANRYDLALRVQGHQDGWILELEYAAELWDPDEVLRRLDMIVSVLERAVADPDALLDRVLEGARGRRRPAGRLGEPRRTQSAEAM